MSTARRDAQEILEDLAEAIDAAAELVALGKNRWDSERPLRLAGEAVVGRLGDIATKLPSAHSGDLGHPFRLIPARVGDAGGCSTRSRTSE